MEGKKINDEFEDNFRKYIQLSNPSTKKPFYNQVTEAYFKEKSNSKKICILIGREIIESKNKLYEEEILFNGEIKEKIIYLINNVIKNDENEDTFISKLLNISKILRLIYETNIIYCRIEKIKNMDIYLYFNCFLFRKKFQKMFHIDYSTFINCLKEKNQITEDIVYKLLFDKKTEEKKNKINNFEVNNKNSNMNELNKIELLKNSNTENNKKEKNSFENINNINNKEIKNIEEFEKKQSDNIILNQNDCNINKNNIINKIQEKIFEINNNQGNTNLQSNGINYPRLGNNMEHNMEKKKYFEGD